MRQCSKCKKKKNLSDFYYNSKIDKYHTQCKKCTLNSLRERGKILRAIKFSNLWFYTRYKALRRRAKRRGIKFELTKKKFRELKINGRCYYCEKKEKVMTIDRMDNKKGYADNNCVVACNRCNVKKNSLTIAEIKIFYKKMVEFR